MICMMNEHFLRSFTEELSAETKSIIAVLGSDQKQNCLEVVEFFSSVPVSRDLPSYKFCFDCLSSSDGVVLEGEEEEVKVLEEAKAEDT